MSAENEKNRYDKNSSDTNFPENIGQGQRTGETITGPLPNGHKIRKTRSNWMGNTIVGPLPGVTPALKADDNIRLGGEHIGDLALAFVAPVGAYNRFDHVSITPS